MLEAEVLHPAKLSAIEAARWRAFQAAEPAFGNPLLGPEFAQAVGEVRDDARVAILRRDGRTEGFLSYQHRPGAFARPIGAPFSDYHALIAAPGVRICAGEALAAAGLSALRFTGLIDPHGAFGEPQEQAEAFLVEIETSSADYLEALRAERPKRFQDWRRLGNKLAREVGEVEIIWRDADPAALAAVMEWKQVQLRRSGLHDFLRPEWTREFFERLAARPRGGLEGVLVTLRAGGRLVAGEFGALQDGCFHPWVASIDAEMTAYSPGLVFMCRFIERMDEFGLRAYDLGPGHEHYKGPFSRSRRMVGTGLAHADAPAGRRAARVERLWRIAGSDRPGMVSSFRRRLDTIASVELTLGGRVAGVAMAVADQARRHHGLVLPAAALSSMSL